MALIKDVCKNVNCIGFLRTSSEPFRFKSSICIFLFHVCIVANSTMVKPKKNIEFFPDSSLIEAGETVDIFCHASSYVGI